MNAKKNIQHMTEKEKLACFSIRKFSKDSQKSNVKVFK